MNINDAAASGYSQCAKWNREQLEAMIDCTRKVIETCQFPETKQALGEQIKTYDMLIANSLFAEVVFLEALKQKGQYDA